MSSSTYALRKVPVNNYNTLRIRTYTHLSTQLGISTLYLDRLVNNATNYYREWDADIKGKRRHLIEATGPLKLIQKRILHRILMRLPPSVYAFGAIKGKSIKENANVHVHAKYIAKLDISNFYPSIHSSKVYRFFVNNVLCSPDVAHAITALTTKDYFLPLGTSTSPFIADQIVGKIDVRIGGLAAKLGLNYTRYVDDIALSGNFDFQRNIPLVTKILKQDGFTVKKEKFDYYTPENPQKEKIITGVRIVDGRVSAPSDFITALEKELKQAIVISRTSKLTREFQTQQHYRGQIGYVMWLDRPIGLKLFRLYRKVKWRHLRYMALKL